MLNARWTDVSPTNLQALNKDNDLAAVTATLNALKYALACARAYLEAVQGAGSRPVDLAAVIQRVTCPDPGTPGGCPYPVDPATRGIFLDWTNLAIKMVVARTDDGKNEDLRVELRSAVQLTFDALEAIANRSTGANPISPVPVWLRVVVLAAMDADAPHLISALAQAAAEELAGPCRGQCPNRRKVAALLTGISTYAITYVKPPNTTDPAQLAAYQEQQREARKQALEGVIDAATDRRGRAHQQVVSLGVGVGYSYNPKIGKLTDQVGKGQLQLPLGVAWQILPGSKQDPKTWGIGFHVMGTALNLGNYVRSTNSPTTKMDWRSIVAPGIQAGVAFGRSNAFFVLGGGVSYVPRFVTTTTSTGTVAQSATKVGVFVQYYFSLWDFN